MKRAQVSECGLYDSDIYHVGWWWALFRADSGTFGRWRNFDQLKNFFYVMLFAFPRFYGFQLSIFSPPMPIWLQTPVVGSWAHVISVGKLEFDYVITCRGDWQSENRVSIGNCPYRYRNIKLIDIVIVFCIWLPQIKNWFEKNTLQSDTNATFRQGSRSGMEE